MMARWSLIALVSCASLFGQLRLPPYTRTVLPNGVVVDLLPRTGVPLVGFRILVKGGVEAEPANWPGSPALRRNCCAKAPANEPRISFPKSWISSAEHSRHCDSAQSSVTTISGEFLKKDFDRGLDLMTDAVLHPTFPEAEVRKTLAQRVDAAKAQKDNPQAAIGAYFAAYFFGPEHPYGHPPDETTLGRIQRQQIADFHDRIYCGRNIAVIVTGDFDPAKRGRKDPRSLRGLAPGQAFEWTKAARAQRAIQFASDRQTGRHADLFLHRPARHRPQESRSREAAADQHAVRRTIHVHAERSPAREQRTFLRRELSSCSACGYRAPLSLPLTPKPKPPKKPSTWRWMF